MKIAILGRKKDTANYENFVKKLPATPLTTLSPGILSECDGLILPGGGDITPAFFGERNLGSRSIDTELDILQFQAIDVCLRLHLPVLGICKGMQVINVAFGGTILQDMPDSSIHRYQNGDQYHPTKIKKDSCLYTLYGETAMVNSAHHQCIHRLGNGLHAIQWCTYDNCVEALVHDSLPILGLQWHPERLAPAGVLPERPAPSAACGLPEHPALPGVCGLPVLALFASWCNGFSGSAGVQDSH